MLQSGNCPLLSVDLSPDSTPQDTLRTNRAAVRWGKAGVKAPIRSPSTSSSTEAGRGRGGHSVHLSIHPSVGQWNDRSSLAMIIKKSYGPRKSILIKAYKNGHTKDYKEREKGKKERKKKNPHLIKELGQLMIGMECEGEKKLHYRSNFSSSNTQEGPAKTGTAKKEKNGQGMNWGGKELHKQERAKEQVQISRLI